LQPELPELALWEGTLRLLLAGVLAGLIGFERELRDQEAGLRTHMLVAGGACLFMIVGVYAWSDFTLSQRVGAVVDPSRVASYVVAGIGFLGGGAIIKYGANIKGLTTAASVWVTAAIGVAVGVGMYGLAIVTAALVIFTLWPLRQIAKRLGLRSAGERRLVVGLEGAGRVAELVAAAEQAGASVESIHSSEEHDGRTVELVLGGAESSPAVVDLVAAVANVRTVEWAR
jgi:putative Mg2+ transporter-C (MgtC) family protein